MNLLKKIFLVALLTSQGLSFSKVWNGNNPLPERWYYYYSHWVENEVTSDYLKNFTNDRFAGDCADAAYALLVIWHYINDYPLDFKRLGYSNTSSKYDKQFKDPKAKVVAFIRDLALNHAWTESLAALDTYPIYDHYGYAMPGDLFIWKMGEGTAATRHTYIVKKIHSDGSLDLFYTNQMARDEGRSILQVKRGSDPSKLSRVPFRKGKQYWGWVRFRPHQFLGDVNGIEKIETQRSGILPISFSQYERFMTLHTKYWYFADLKARLQVPSYQKTSLIQVQNVAKIANELCKDFKNRSKGVTKALSFLSKSKSCLSYGDFDKFSTPLGDTALKLGLFKLKKEIEKVDRSNFSVQDYLEMNPDIESILNLPTGESSPTNVGTHYCEFAVGKSNTNDDITVNFQHVYNAFKLNHISPNPHDTFYKRWGIRSEGSVQSNAYKNCEVFYGFPEDYNETNL